MAYLEHLGNCYHIALALQSLCEDASLVFLYGYRKPTNFEPEAHIMIHVGVKHEDNFYDELGLRGSPREVLREFEKINEAYDYVEIKEFPSGDHLEFKQLVSQCGAQISLAKIDYYRRWCQAQPERFHFIKLA